MGLTQVKALVCGFIVHQQLVTTIRIIGIMIEWLAKLRAGTQAIDFEAKVGASDILPTDVIDTAPWNGAYVVA